MRFLLYNVRYCAGIGRGFHLPFPMSGYLRRTESKLREIAEFIKDQHPDLVGLIEMDSGSLASGGRNQVHEIAKTLGCFHSFESKYAETSLNRLLPVLRKHVNAFLTGDAIRNEKFHYFERGVKRLVIELELDDVVILLVHLSLGFRHRRDQLCELCEMVKTIKKPHIVAGDFNMFWGYGEIRWFLAATNLTSANVARRPSYPSRAPRRELDFILHSPEIRVTGFEMPKALLSDHLPLVCDFEVRPA